MNKSCTQNSNSKSSTTTPTQSMSTFLPQPNNIDLRCRLNGIFANLKNENAQHIDTFSSFDKLSLTDKQSIVCVSKIFFICISNPPACLHRYIYCGFIGALVQLIWSFLIERFNCRARRSSICISTEQFTQTETIIES